MASIQTHADVTIISENPTNHKIFFKRSDLKPPWRIELTWFQVWPNRNEEYHLEIYTDYLYWQSWSNDQNAKFKIEYRFKIYSYYDPGHPPRLFGSEGDRIEFWGQRAKDESQKMTFQILLNNKDHIINSGIIKGMVYLPNNTVFVAKKLPNIWVWRDFPR